MLAVAVVVLSVTSPKSARLSRLIVTLRLSLPVDDIVMPPGFVVTEVRWAASPGLPAEAPMYVSTVLLSVAASVTPPPPNAEIPVEL